MCSMDKTAALHLPQYILLILVVCACILAVHFVAEGLAPVPGEAMFDRVAQGGQAFQVDEQSENNFIFPSLTRLPFEPPAAPLQCVVAFEAHSFSLSPLLPPPNS
jgi:hypothetical protein